jgi:alpha-amylase
MKKLFSLLLVAIIAASALLTGCGTQEYQDPVDTLTATASTDKYRNYYQIFVNSFADSNGDQIGDLQGIIDHLDYLNDGDPNTGNDLGVDGIWLTPIMPSPSYHKYDVTDYYNIDPDFGTLETFDKLVSECHKRGINLIIDLVLNHASSQHPYYLKAVEEVEKGNLDGYAQYFEIHPTSYFASDTQTNYLSHAMACEANFSNEMPEWNLNSDKTREEFAKISKFWLDRGVDGFRLDAVKYFTNKSTDGTEFLTWFYDKCKETNPNVYVVGENWDDDSQIQEIFKSGIDSQFAFKFSQTSGTLTTEVIAESGISIAKKVMNYNEKMYSSNENYIPTMFLSNHDMVRSANSLEPQGLSYEKMAAALYLLFPGTPFIYYGEEIGITAPNTTSDSAYRTPMIFDSNNLPNIWVNGVGDVAKDTKYGGAKQQQADPNSLLSFYSRIIKIKNQNPEIARGKITGLQTFDNTAICAYYVEYNGTKLMIIHNMNAEENAELTITDDMIANPEIRAELVASSPVDKDGAFTSTEDENAVYQHTAIKDGVLTMPAQSTVILKTAENSK